ncbi:hypothetical protein [Conexibacter sp. DBS9H8]|uniref:hypothetical protein n=1 Tax=Conexibacter sp. DBS9H8 TaxID=2937801 RepID=UPI00200C88B0|nr:hypothetical protein [Conexibacter sp. DBS9H8]
MAAQKRKRSRKARAGRRAGPSAAGGPPDSRPAPTPDGPGGRVRPEVGPHAAATSSRRAQREARVAAASRASAQASRSLGTYGERPASIFAPLPVSEIAILAGIVAVVIGFLNRGGPALEVGVIVAGLGVVEFTARDHFSGYRSHTTLLAAVPAVIVEVLFVVLAGVPQQRFLLFAPVIPVFALSFWGLRRAFAIARHARVTRPSA